MPVPRLVLLLLSALTPVFGQTPPIGAPAPPLTLERMIPAGPAANWTALRGRPVVMEFWATWCANCVAEIPRLNELSAKFPEIQFLSVTDEPASTVEPFLAKRPISGHIGIDRDGATFRAYGVDARPRTFLVDRTGLVRGSMHPVQVNEAVLSDLAADRPVQPAGLPGRPAILEEAGADPVFAVMLRPSNSAKTGGVMGLDAGRMQGTNLFLRTILSYAWSIGERRLEGPDVLLGTRYDFCVLLPDGVAGDRELLRQMLERAFKLKIRRESRPEEAVVLRSTVGRRPASGGIAHMTALARILEGRLKRAVVDESGIDTYAWFELPESRDELTEALRSRLGIELAYETRPVDYFVIESMELPSYRVR